MAAKNDILIDKDGNQIFPATTAEQVSYDGNMNVKQAIKRGAVRNKVAPTVASMTDKEQIYVYTGTEEGYTFGNWYYWDGAAWTSGGAYNAIEVNTDGTLTEEGVPADAKATGDKLSELKDDLANGETNDGAIKTRKLEGVVFTPSINLVSEETTNQGIKGDNTFTDSSMYKLHKEYIPVVSGDIIYRLNINGGALIGYYDIDKNPIPQSVKGRTALTTEAYFTPNIPDTVKYIRIADSDATVSNQVWSKTPVTEYVPYGDVLDLENNPIYKALNEKKVDKENNVIYPKLKNKRWLFMGDSITEGVDISVNGSYYNKAIEYSGAIGTNKGIGGSLISNGQYSGQRATSILTLSTLTDTTSQYYIDFTQYEILTIFAGTNDWGMVNQDVFDALDTALKNIQEKNPNLRICFFTPMYRSRKTLGDGMNSDDHSYNARTNTFDSDNCYYLYDLADGLQEVCRKNHIPCKNMYRDFQITKYNADTLLYDGIHPNSVSVPYLANVICQFVSDNCGY